MAKTPVREIVNLGVASRGAPASNSHVTPCAACGESGERKVARTSQAAAPLGATTPSSASSEVSPRVNSGSLADGSSASLQSASDLMRKGETLPRRLGPGEVRRRVWHMLPGLLPFALFAIPHPDPISLQAQLIVLALVVILTVFILRNFSKIARPGEQQWLINVLSYPATVVLMLFLFPAHAEFAAVVVIVLAFGDGSATLFGLLYGRRHLPWNQEKTWVGFWSFLACSAPVSALALWVEARPAVSVQYALICGVSAAALAAIAESLPSKITDNLRSGLAAGIGVVVAHGALLLWT